MRGAGSASGRDSSTNPSSARISMCASRRRPRCAGARRSPPRSQGVPSSPGSSNTGSIPTIHGVMDTHCRTFGSRERLLDTLRTRDEGPGPVGEDLVVIERETVTSRVVVELRRRILTGSLAGGAPLRQESLAADFGVSRIPLREAIRQLEAEGLVVSFPHRGVCVAALSRAEFEELCELRQQLEPWL